MVFLPFFAADEAQTLDAIFRNDEEEVKGVPSFMTLERLGYLPLRNIAATAIYEETGKGLIASGCTRTCSFIPVTSG